MIEVTDEQVRAIVKDEIENVTTAEMVMFLTVSKRIIELHEANKPKPEPVAYKICNPAGCVLVESKRQAEKLASEYGDGTYQPLYTTPPTREPLSDDEINNIVFNLSKGSTLFDFAHLVEQAHGIF